MIDSSRSYKRKQRRSAVEILPFIVAVATVIAAVAGVIAIVPMFWKGDKSIERSQLSTIDGAIPNRRNISRRGAVVVQKNITFSLAVGQGVLLQGDHGEDAFALSELPYGRVRPGIIRVYLNGMRKDIALGETIETSDDGCFVWIVSEASLIEGITKSARWIFEYHCNP